MGLVYLSTSDGILAKGAVFLTKGSTTGAGLVDYMVLILLLTSLSKALLLSTDFFLEGAYSSLIGRSGFTVALRRESGFLLVFLTLLFADSSSTIILRGLAIVDDNFEEEFYLGA